jgi:hypothetical protein
MNMPYVTKSGSSLLGRIYDELSLLTDRRYWELKSELGANKILHGRILTKVKVGNMVADAGTTAYEMGGLKAKGVGYTVRALLAFHSKSSDKAFDEPPKILEERLNGDPHKQLESMLHRLHEKNDKVEFVS